MQSRRGTLRGNDTGIPALLSCVDSAPNGDGEKYFAQARQMFYKRLDTAKIQTDRSINEFCWLTVKEYAGTDLNSLTADIDLKVLKPTVADIEMGYYLLNSRRMLNCPKQDMLRVIQEIQNERREPNNK